MRLGSTKMAMVSAAVALLLGVANACCCAQGGAAITPTDATTLPTGSASQATVLPSTQGAAPTQSPALGSKPAGAMTVTLGSSPNPPGRGNNTFEVLVSDGQGHPVTDAQVSYNMDMTNMSMGKQIVTAAPLGDGRYSGRVRVSMAGPWRVIVSIARAGQTDTARFDFSVR